MSTFMHLSLFLFLYIIKQFIHEYCIYWHLIYNLRREERGKPARCASQLRIMNAVRTIVAEAFNK